MDNERLKALCERIQEEGASVLVKQLIDLLEESDSPTASIYIPGVWSDWGGGECPVGVAQVEVELRNGTKVPPCISTELRWGHRGDKWDIVRFCVVTYEENSEQNETVPDDSSFGDSVLKENFAAKQRLRSGGRSGGSAWVAKGKAIIDRDRREHPLGPRSRGSNLGCQPGQFNDIDWRKGK